MSNWPSLGKGGKGIILSHWVSYFSMHQNHSQGLLKNRLPPRLSNSVTLGPVLWVCTSDKFPDVIDDNDACLRTMLWELLVYVKPSHQIFIFLIAEIWGRHLAGITPMLLSGRSTNYLMEPASQPRGSWSHMLEQADQKKKKIIKWSENSKVRKRELFQSGPGSETTERISLGKAK